MIENCIQKRNKSSFVKKKTNIQHYSFILLLLINHHRLDKDRFSLPNGNYLQSVLVSDEKLKSMRTAICVMKKWEREREGERQRTMDVQ